MIAKIPAARAEEILLDAKGLFFAADKEDDKDRVGIPARDGRVSDAHDATVHKDAQRPLTAMKTASPGPDRAGGRLWRQPHPLLLAAPLPSPPPPPPPPPALGPARRTHSPTWGRPGGTKKTRVLHPCQLATAALNAPCASHKAPSRTRQGPAGAGTPMRPSACVRLPPITRCPWRQGCLLRSRAHETATAHGRLRSWRRRLISHARVSLRESDGARERMRVSEKRATVPTSAQFVQETARGTRWSRACVGRVRAVRRAGRALHSSCRGLTRSQGCGLVTRNASERRMR